MSTLMRPIIFAKSKSIPLILPFLLDSHWNGDMLHMEAVLDRRKRHGKLNLRRVKAPKDLLVLPE
jgi:hypothetical protein